MAYLITTTAADGTVTKKYPAVGSLGALMDAAYDGGAFGVTAMVIA